MVSTESAIAVAAQCEAGEEDGANDEDNAGDDRHPGSGLIDPVGTMLARQSRRDGCGRRFLLKCFSHVAILMAAV
jgi:hypothetical protein